MIIQRWYQIAQRVVRLPPEDHDARAVLLRRKAYRFSPDGLHFDECCPGRSATLIDAPFNWVTL